MKALPHPGERGRASSLTARPEGRTVLMQPFHRRRFPPPAKRGRPRWRRPASVLPLVAGAALGGRLIGELALAEAVRRHQGDVLRRADELLQLRIEGVVAALVLLSEDRKSVV